MATKGQFVTDESKAGQFGGPHIVQTSPPGTGRITQIVPRGFVALGTDRLATMVKLGDGAAVVTPDSYGGWELEERPKDVALTVWPGGVPTGVEIPFTIGSKRAPTPKATERFCRTLERLAGQGGKREPPAIVVNGGGAVPHDVTHAPHLRWVIEALDWDSGAERRRGGGRRYFAAGTLVVRVHTPEGRVEGLSPAVEKNHRDRGIQPSERVHGNRYQVAAGDTLKKIGKKLRLSKGEVREMKRLNAIRDADKKLTPGLWVKLPKRSATFGK